MNGLKTFVSAIVSFISIAGLMTGNVIPEEILSELRNNIEATIISLSGLYAVAMIILRRFTSSEFTFMGAIKKIFNGLSKIQNPQSMRLLFLIPCLSLMFACSNNELRDELNLRLAKLKTEIQNTIDRAQTACDSGLLSQDRCNTLLASLNERLNDVNEFEPMLNSSLDEIEDKIKTILGELGPLIQSINESEICLKTKTTYCYNSIANNNHWLRYAWKGYNNYGPWLRYA